MRFDVRALGLLTGLGCLLATGPAQAGPPDRRQDSSEQRSSERRASEQRSSGRRFTNLARTFALDLPAGFRQLAPSEAVELRERPDTPPELKTTSPRAFYAVGPIDRWLAGEIVSPWLYVMEQDAEWYIDGDFETLLRERWRENGRAAGIEHEISDVREAKVGPHGHEVRLARRTSRSRDGRSVSSLDVYAPTGGKQVTLSFCAWTEDFDRWSDEFESALATLTFARPSRGEQSLSDRLWTPLLTGGIVGLVLLAMYKHTRRRR